MYCQGLSLRAVAVDRGAADNTSDKAGDNTGDKAMGETNVIVVADHIHNVLIAAWPSYLREDEGLVRVLRNGHHYDMYQCDPRTSHCRRVPKWVPQPSLMGVPRDTTSPDSSGRVRAAR
jgi:hypothetical protein